MTEYNAYTIKTKELEKLVIEDKLDKCPCCGYKVRVERGAFEVCPICHWEDDGQYDPRADEVWGGANGDLSLTQARENFKKFGFCDTFFLSYESDERKILMRLLNELEKDLGAAQRTKIAGETARLIQKVRK